MSADGSTLNSSFSTTSTVRPRNRRLISYNDDLDSDTGVNSAQGSPQARLTSPLSSRGASPAPRAHLPRPEGSRHGARNAQTNGTTTRKTTRPSEPLSPTSLLGSGLWESSWSSLQGMASSLLGNDTAPNSQGASWSRSPMAQWRKANKSNHNSGPSQWGPKASGPSQLAAGSQEERQALVQAKKREVLLLADANKALDAKGNHKRRDSDDRAWPTTSQEQASEDALVYIHRVKPQDTLAGVMIKYGCQPAVFRKVNRFWPNDNIQIRKVVMLPVEACSIRGRRIDPDLLDLLNNDTEEIPSSSGPNPDVIVSSPQANPTEPAEEPSWKHEHFVQIDGIPESVEIGRISRRSLGFFPPSRRKSVTFSDIDPLSRSTDPSLDLVRQSSNQQPFTTLSATQSPRLNPILRPPRHRSSSSASLSQSPQFLSRLRGPGGVGNLTGRSAVTPGPAQDALNKYFEKHHPQLLPSATRSSFDDNDDNNDLTSQTSRASSHTGTGLQDVGGAIEGWMRRVAGKMSEGGNNGASAIGPGNGGWAAGGMGDLIELGETPLDLSTPGDRNIGAESLRNNSEYFASSSQGRREAHGEERIRERMPYRGRGDADDSDVGKKDD